MNTEENKHLNYLLQYFKKAIFSTVVYNRIRELSKAATRGWPGKRVHTRGEAYSLLLAFKKMYPRRCFARKKKVKHI